MGKSELILFIILFIWNIVLSFKISTIENVIKGAIMIFGNFLNGFLKGLEDVNEQRKNRKDN